MKKVFLSILAVGALLTSCQDAYEISQPGYVTEESQVFTNNASIQRGINGLYNTMVGETEVDFTTVFTDEVGLGYQNGGQGINDGSYGFVMETGNAYAEFFWSSNYNIINRANRMLSVIDGLAQKNPDEAADLQQSKAELLALRAYANLKLFAYFTPDYTNPSGQSIMKLDFLQTDDYSVLIPRSTVSEIVSFIEKDVQDALTLRYNTNAGTGNTYITKGFLQTILVKLYSMTGNYNGVISNAEQIVGSGKYSLGNGISYLLMFNDSDLDSNPEIVFRLKRVINVVDGSRNEIFNIANIWYTNRPNMQGTVLYEVGRSLYNELDKLDPENVNEPASVVRKDIRYEANVHDQSEVAANYASLPYDQFITNDKLLVGKYRGRQQALMQNDVMIFRYADVLLALAEARAAQGALTGTNAVGDFSTVSSIIYNIRKARINNNSFPDLTEPASMPTITTAQSAWKAILNERRMEFAFEGQRYLDVKRLGVKANEGFVRDAKDCARNGACALEANSFKLTLPIPRAEMLSNNKMVQNPGY